MQQWVRPGLLVSNSLRGGNVAKLEAGCGRRPSGALFARSLEGLWVLCRAQSAPVPHVGPAPAGAGLGRCRPWSGMWPGQRAGSSPFLCQQPLIVKRKLMETQIGYFWQFGTSLRLGGKSDLMRVTAVWFPDRCTAPRSFCISGTTARRPAVYWTACPGHPAKNALCNFAAAEPGRSVCAYVYLCVFSAADRAFVAALLCCGSGAVRCKQVLYLWSTWRKIISICTSGTSKSSRGRGPEVPK